MYTAVMLLGEQLSGGQHESQIDREKKMDAEIQRLTALFAPFLEEYREIRINEGNFPTDLERFLFIEIRDKVTQAIQHFRDTFQPGGYADHIFLEKLNLLKKNLQEQKLVAVGVFVEKELQKSNQGTYQESMTHGAKNTLTHIVEGNYGFAQYERMKMVDFQMKQQVKEEIGVMAALGIPLENEKEELALSASTKKVMLEADKPFEYLLMPDQLYYRGKKFSQEVRVLAYTMNRHYLATNAVVESVKKDGIEVLDDPQGVVKDTLFSPAPTTGIKPFTALGSISGMDYSGKSFTVEIDEVGAVKDAEVEETDRLVAKNIVGIMTAKQLVSYAESIGVSREQVQEFFLLATRQDMKNLLNIVKTFCETLLGEQPKSLAAGLQTFAELTVKEKKILVDALFKANAGWKVAPEDDAIYETLEELNKPENTATLEEIFEAKSNKRIGSSAMGSFTQMVKAKGWTEVAKDIFQVAQGLVQLDVSDITFDEHGGIKNLYVEEKMTVSQMTVEENNQDEKILVPA